MAQRARYTPGSFCWVGLAASDRADATAFYTRLFGWQADELAADQTGTYSDPGTWCWNELGTAPRWLPHFAVENVEDAAPPSRGARCATTGGGGAHAQGALAGARRSANRHVHHLRGRHGPLTRRRRTSPSAGSC